MSYTGEIVGPNTIRITADPSPRNHGQVACGVGAVLSLSATAAGCIIAFEPLNATVKIAVPILMGVVALGFASMPAASRYGRCACPENCGPGCSITGTVLTGLVAPIPIVLGILNAVNVTI